MTGGMTGATIAGTDAGAATSSIRETGPGRPYLEASCGFTFPAESTRPMAPRLGSEGPALERGLLFSGLQAIIRQARFHTLTLATPVYSGVRR